MQIGHFYEISEMLSPKIKPFGMNSFANHLCPSSVSVHMSVQYLAPEVPSHQTCFSRPPPSRPTTRPSCFSGVAEILEWAAPCPRLCVLYKVREHRHPSNHCARLLCYFSASNHDAI